MEVIFEYFRSQQKRIRETLSTSTPHPDNTHANNDLSPSILGFCFASALGFLVLYFESVNELPIPLSVHLFGLFMACSFAATFVVQFLASVSYQARILKRMANVFVALAFFLALAIPSPFWLRIVYCFIFLLGSFTAFKFGNI